LFKLELELLQDMVTGGINIARVTALSHCAHAIEVVDVLKVTARERWGSTPVHRRRTDRRGRPRKPDAQRRRTTLAGRRPPSDPGTDELRRRKRAATGREDLEVNGAAVLYGHDLLDRAQYDTLGTVTELLQRVGRAWGQRDGNLNGLWEAITGALTGTSFAPAHR
jgi:hypothetical protein